MEKMLLGVVFWIAPSLLIGWIAMQKGRDWRTFTFLSLVFSPLIMIVVAIVVPARLAPPGATVVPCLSCRRPISDQAAVCPNCRTDQASERRKIEMFGSPRPPPAGREGAP